MTRRQLSVKLLNIEDELARLVWKVENEGINFVGRDALGEQMSLEIHAQIMRSNVQGIIDATNRLAVALNETIG